MDDARPVAIKIDNLSKTYSKRNGLPLKAVDSLSLSVTAGQVFGFLRPNGAGKTTTIKMICGLIAPDAGEVRLNGYDVVRQRGEAMREIGAVLEGTRNIYWRLSAWDNLMYFGHLKGRWGKELKRYAELLLRDLELWERRGDAVRNFSRGMQQKVAVACALIADPPIILLDEPTLGLDVQAARTVRTWVERLAKERGKTVVLTTHQLDMAQELCDRVAIISKGRLVTDRPIAELLALFRQEFYQIRLKGHLDDHVAMRFDSLSVTKEENGETLLSGSIADQSMLHDLLGKLHELGLPLLSVAKTEPDLEEVFVRLMGEG